MTVQDCAFFYEKKGRERKYETMIVFAGISLACVCYMNPDGTDAWCEPDGCNEEGSYCATDGSYCKLGRSPACCSGLSCVNNECAPTTGCAAGKSYVYSCQNPNTLTTNCCDIGNWCWNEDLKVCKSFADCSGCPVSFPQNIYSPYRDNPACWNPYPSMACCVYTAIHKFETFIIY